MTGGHPSIRPQHHVRFYIFMITLVIIGVFFVLYANNDDTGTSIGSAIVGYAVGDTNTKKLEQASLKIKNNEGIKTSKEISISLSLDIVPAVSQETSIDAVTLLFNKPETVIRINNDKLELNSLEEVDFRVISFAGTFSLEGDKLSLSGDAKGIEVNGLKFSSEEVIKISFEKLDYILLNVSGIKLDGLKFTQGNGEIKVGEKLSYPLQDEELVILNFKGAVKIDENSNSSLLSLKGNAGSISISGGLLDFNLG